MISPKSITRKDANDAGVSKAIDSYYQEEKDDYYTREKQPSEWYGSLASDLGLSGKIEKSDFTEMLEGKRKGKLLRDNNFKRHGANDRLGLDLTFNAPKSVSIQALVAGDSRLIEAHHEAVKESLAMLEKHAQARKKVEGKSRVENTGKLAVAMFRHDTNRNNDPHLHTHSVVLNVTQRSDKAYRALHNDKLVKTIPQASQAYQTNLAKKCKELGYDVKLNDNGTFDLAHITRKQIDEFSTRSKQIEQVLKERGLSRESANREQRQMANFVTKQRKRILPKELVQQQWAITAEKLGLTKILSPQNIIKSKEEKYERKQLIRKGNRSNRIDGVDNQFDGSRRGRGGYDTINDRHGSDGNTTTTTNTFESNTIINEKRGIATNRLRELFGRNVASVARKSKVFLSNNKRFQLHNRRTSTNIRLRWDVDSSGSSGRIDSRIKIQDDIRHQNKLPMLTENSFKTIQDNKHKDESLRDMMAYQAPISEITEQWERVAKDLRINFEPGEVSNNENDEFSGDKLITHVIEHLSDKRVDMTREQVYRETMVRGIGEVDAFEAERLINQKIKEGVLIKAETLYKTADDKNDLTAKTFIKWKKNFSQSANLSESEARKEVQKSIREGRLLPIGERFVTKKDLDREKNILQIMEKGKGKHQAFYAETEAEEILSKTTLNQGQKSAASLVMTTKDKVVGIQGYAGVGKSYTLSQLLPQLEKAGADIHIFAPYGSQVKSLNEDGLQANTLAKLLHSPTMQDDINQNSVIIVDEAGVVSNADAEKLLMIAENKNAKVVFLGDTAQTKAIRSGKPFDLLQDNDMATATIDEIQRQKNEVLKKAVIESAMGDQKSSIKTLKKSIYEIKNTHERLDVLVDKFMAYDDKTKKKTLILTGTNKDKAYLDNRIREELRLKGEGVETEQLKQADLSDSELKYARYYKPKMQIESHRKPKNKAMKQGELYTVIGNKRHILIIANSDGEEIEINPAVEKLTAYESNKFEVSKGDRLRVSKSDKDMGIATGDSLIVTSVNSNHIRATNEKGESFKFNTKRKNHLDYNYSSTVHSSQGLTVDNVLININTKSLTTSKEVYYVAISRAKEQAIIVTDDTSKLSKAISRGSEKQSAYQMINESNQMINEKKKELSINKTKEYTLSI